MVRGSSFPTKKRTILQDSVKGLRAGTLDSNGKCDWNAMRSMEQHFPAFQLYRHKKQLKVQNNHLKMDQRKRKWASASKIISLTTLCCRFLHLSGILLVFAFYNFVNLLRTSQSIDKIFCKTENELLDRQRTSTTEKNLQGRKISFRCKR